MSTIRKLRLGSPPKTENVKPTFACLATLKADLDRYAPMHAQAYGEAVDPTMLIPNKLDEFMAEDGAFRKEVSRINKIPTEFYNACYQPAAVARLVVSPVHNVWKFDFL